MQGIVKSYLPAKGYGFIDGEDGQSYFLHKGNLNNKRHLEALVIGAKVQFEPEPTPKGMKAGHVDVLPRFMAKRISPFILSRKGVVPGTEIVWQRDFVWEHKYEDTFEARKAIEEFAQHVCANAVLNFQLHKSKGVSGNYVYSEYRPEFTLAIVVESVEVINHDAVKRHELLLDAARDLVARHVEEFFASNKTGIAAVSPKKTSVLKQIFVVATALSALYLLSKGG